MRLGGVGNGNDSLDSHEHSHRITNCIHDHDSAKEKTGGAPMTLAASYSTMSKQQVSQEIPELLDAMRNIFRSGRSLFGKVWGRDEEATEEQSETASATAGARTTGTLLFSNVQTPQKMISEYPYFTAVQSRKHTVPHRLHTRFRDLSKRFRRNFGRQSCEFSNESGLNDRRQASKEDLRKKSRYRERNVEFDCVLTDDSYLLDSYDKKGEYSRLTTERK